MLKSIRITSTPRVYILYCLKYLLIVWPEFELTRKTKPTSNGLLSGSKASWDLVILKNHPEYWTRKWNAIMRAFRTLNHVCLVTYRLSMNSWKHLLVKKGIVWNTLSGHLVSMLFSSSNIFVEVSQATLIVFYGLICDIMLHHVVVTCLANKNEKKLNEINWLVVVNSFMIWN